jgi:FKBP-type peptidyl-prolyl cis-trans isomerase
MEFSFRVIQPIKEKTMPSNLIAIALTVVILLYGCADPQKETADPQKETRDLYNVCVYQGVIKQEMCMNEAANQVDSSAFLGCVSDAFRNVQQCSKTFWDQGDHVHELDQLYKDRLREDAGLPPELTKQQEQEQEQEARAEAEKAKAESVYREGVEKFVKGAVFTESGLAYRILKKGSGPKPNIDSIVEVHYSGRLLDGIEFDSSMKRGVPAQFGVTQVISGWTEALLLMPEGSKWRVYIPAKLAYGSSGAGVTIGPNQDLIFEIELIQSNVE